VTDNAFSRSSLTIHKNDSVRWSWKSTDNLHNVTVDRGPTSFHSKTRSGDYVYSHKFRSTGTWRLICTRHADDMRITVRVKRPS
jgi:plastocyanin